MDEGVGWTRGPGPGRQRRRRGTGADEERPNTDGIEAWLTGRLPEGWFEQQPTVTIDRDEILIVGRLAEPELEGASDPLARAGANIGRVQRFREETREDRMAIAREAEHRYMRTISWGVEIGTDRQIFTNLSVPVMTRLRQPERQVLDTLVESGVARSRSDALAWCVKLVAANTDAWLSDLRTAMEKVEEVRQQGPSPS